MTEPEDPQAQPPPPYGQPSGPYGQPPPYGQQPPPYGQQPPPYGYPYGAPPATGTNGLAIASFICAFFCWPLGLTFGLVAKSQIRRRGGGGDGLATAGIIISILSFVLLIVLSATGHAVFHFNTNSN